MQLTLKNEQIGHALIVRCRGRIVTGDETQFLQSELDKLTQAHLTKTVVLNLADVTYVDSGGLGTLVRMLGRLRAARGDLRICQTPPFVEKVLKLTNLLSVFHPYASEKDAIESFSQRAQTPREGFQPSNHRIVCLDSSLDLLAYLRVLLQRATYDVFTTQYLSDAVAFAKGTRSSVLICGPAIRANAHAMEKVRQNIPEARLIHLPPDFSTSDADQAGPNLLDQVRSLLASPPAASP